MATKIELVSHDAARQLEIFSEEMFAVLAADESEPWGRALGHYVQNDGLEITFPVSLSVAGYTRFEGDVRFRDLAERSLTVRTETWQDGVSMLAQVLESDRFSGWLDQPAAMATEARRLPNTLVAALLEDNPYLDFYSERQAGGFVPSTRALFASDHPYNVVKPGLGTFDNDVASGTYTAIDETFADAVHKHFRSIKAANGKPLGLRWTHLLLPAARELEAKKFFERDTLIQVVENAASTENVGGVALKNIHYGTVKYIVSDELSDDDVVYALALDKPGLRPWIIQDAGAPEELVHDKTSSMYLNSLKVGLAYVMQAAAAGALPHPILRVDLG